jgi:polysaccharide biosynthesis protein PslH
MFFHNIDALTFMVHDILPLIRAKIHDCRLIIIGAGESKRVRELAQADDVIISGYVIDLNDALNKAAIFVAPLRFSAGVLNKVLEAMAAGVPVVATSNVAAGLGAEPGREILVADQAQAFATKVINLVEDRQHQRALGLAGRRFVEERFSWHVAVQRMKEIEGDLH